MHACALACAKFLWIIIIMVLLLIRPSILMNTTLIGLPPTPSINSLYTCENAKNYGWSLPH